MWTRNLAADDRDEIGEGAAGVDPDRLSALRRGRAAARRGPIVHDALEQNFEFRFIGRGRECGDAIVERKLPSISGRGSNLPAASAASAGANRPQREPMTEISLITNGARLIAAPAAAVLFRMIVPRGRTSSIARAKAVAAPGAIDHDVEFAAQRKFAGESRVRAHASRSSFSAMVSRDDRRDTSRLERQRDHRAEPAVAQNHDRSVRASRV